MDLFKNILTIIIFTFALILFPWVFWRAFTCTRVTVECKYTANDYTLLRKFLEQNGYRLYLGGISQRSNFHGVNIYFINGQEATRFKLATNTDKLDNEISMWAYNM